MLQRVIHAATTAPRLLGERGSEVMRCAPVWCSGNEERARSATPTWSGGSSAPGSYGRQPSDEVSSGDEDARKEKRRRFEEHRRSHYQMKQALQRCAITRVKAKAGPVTCSV